MTTQELRELDAWIAEHVFGVSVPHPFFKPTEDPRGAMDVLKKCAEKHQHDIAIGTAGPTDWRVWAGELNGATYASSLELAICLFAKQLFSKPTTK